MGLNMYASLLFAGFIAAFAIAPVAPEAGNILFLVVGVVGLTAMRSDALALFRRPIVWMSLTAIALVGFAYFLAAGTAGLAGVLYFAPLLCVWPLVNAAHRAELGGVVPMLAILALCGASGAGLIAIQDVIATGTTRSGGGIANPIHFADVALLVGFVGVLGVFFARGRWRLMFFVSPLMAVAAVLLSGTRGAVVATVVMLVTMIIGVAAARLVSRRALALGIGIFALLCLAAVQLGAGSLSGVQRVLADIGDTLINGVPTDTSTDLRLQMYLGGLRAFLASPLIGHGPLNFTSVSGALADVPFDGVPHLHNDLVDMAASAGILGLVAYFLLLLAPIVEVFRAPHPSVRAERSVVIITLVAGYLVMGLTNAMFGILTVTTLFAAICVLAGVLSNERPQAPQKADVTG